MDKTQNGCLIKKACPYCDKTFDIDKDGSGEEFLQHLLDRHYDEVVADFEVYEAIMKDKFEEVRDYYELEIKDLMLDRYEDNILDKWGEAYVEGAMNDLIDDAAEVEDED